jgi:hypothetical protein
VIQSKLKGRLVLLDNREKSKSLGAMRQRALREEARSGPTSLSSRRNAPAHGTVPPSLGSRGLRPFTDLFAAAADEDAAAASRLRYGHYAGLRRLWRAHAAALVSDRLGAGAWSRCDDAEFCEGGRHEIRARLADSARGAGARATLAARRERERAVVECLLGADLHGSEPRIVRARIRDNRAQPHAIEVNFKISADDRGCPARVEGRWPLALLVGSRVTIVQETARSFVVAVPQDDPTRGGAALMRILKRDCDWAFEVRASKEDDDASTCARGGLLSAADAGGNVWSVVFRGDALATRRRGGVAAHRDKKGRRTKAAEHRKKVAAGQRRRS